MSLSASVLNETFPKLFASTCWADLLCHFELADTAPPTCKIANVNVIPFVGNQCLVTRLRDGSLGLPGGTLEPGEDYRAALVRELVEEQGARLLTFEPLGAWHCHSSSTKPFRAHLPHPDSCRFMGYGNVRIFRAPTAPEGGEDIAAVEAISVEKAHKHFVDMGRPELGEAYLLAATVRSTRGPGRSVLKHDCS